jgi:peptidyl-prolyl cis-trans isomerase D
MAVLENIRKRTTVLILIIGMALFAFVISGIFTSNNTMGGPSVIGEVNGEEIPITYFRQQLEIAAQQSNSSTTMELVKQVWNREVRALLMEQQFDDLGISVEGDQIVNFIKDIPAYAQAELFQNEEGVFDSAKFIAAVADWKVNNPNQYSLWLNDEAAIMHAAKEQTYFNLIKAGLIVTQKEGNYAYKAANDKVTIQYAHIPYASVSDSLVKVSEADIEAYMNKHPEDFKQEPARDLHLVYFQEKPSAEDEKAIEDAVQALLLDSEEYNAASDTTEKVPGFLNTTDMAAFLDRNSDIKFDTIYRSKNAISFQFRDSIISLSKGETFGPYKEDGYLKVSKMMDIMKEGTAKASHIIIQYVGSQSANPNVTRTKSEAETLARNLLRQARSGNAADFYQLARDNSDGPTATRGGDLGYFVRGEMTPKFNDFVFNSKVGRIGFLETEFGFHIVKIDDKQPTYQIATLARSLDASEETINSIFTDATAYEMDVTENPSTFDRLAKEKNYDLRQVSKITALDESLPGLEAQRSIVQWAFNDDTKIGAIRKFSVNSGYAVVQVVGIYRSGKMTVSDASVKAIPMIRKERKTEIIKSNYSGKSLEDIASQSGIAVSTASALSIQSPIIPGAGRELNVVGRAFGMEVNQQSDLIQGESGIFKIQLVSKEAGVELDNYSTYASSIAARRLSSASFSAYNALEKAAEVEDNRSIFY